MFEILLTPGPTRVPERVVNAGARAISYHRSADFSRSLESVIARLRVLFGTRQHIFVVAAASRGGLEAAFGNLLAPDDEILNVGNGHFAQQAAKIARDIGFSVHNVCEAWERPADPDAVRRALRELPRVRVVMAAHSETSTGILNPIAELGRVAAERDCYFVVDGVSSVGGVETKFDEWGVDVLVTGSQKCLLSPPGLSLVACSDRALERARALRGRTRVSYWDFNRLHEFVSHQLPQTPYTTPTTLVLSLAEGLRLIEEIGIEAYWAFHRHRATATRNAVRAMGLRIFPSDMDTETTLSPTVSTVNIDNPQQLVTTVQHRFGVRFARGLGRLAGSTFRIGHLGAITREEITLGMIALWLSVTSRAQAGPAEGRAIIAAIEEAWENVPDPSRGAPVPG